MKEKPSFLAIIKNGKIDFRDKESFAIFLGSLEGQIVEITIGKKIDKRTDIQNNAIHLYFRQLSDALNDAGYGILKVLKIDVPFTPILVKELLWRRVQEVYLKKQSTTQLNKLEDISAVYDILNRSISEQFKIHIPFPDKDEEARQVGLVIEKS